MAMAWESGADEPYTLDDLALGLQDLRTAAGHPSYAEIARRITERRRERGLPDGEVPLARTTVYDAFRTGRRRIDEDLVVEIVRALGADEDEARLWAAGCRQGQRYAEQGRRTRPVRAVHAVTPLPDVATPEAAETPAQAWPWSAQSLTAVLLGCLAFNLGGRFLVDAWGLPLHLDMLGTATAAILLGPWWGAGVGLGTNLVGVASSGLVSLPFAVVNVAGALVWGYGVRRWGLGRSLPRFLGLNLLVAATCTALAVPLLLLLDGVVQHGSAVLVANLRAMSGSLTVGLVGVNLLVSVVDKLISGFLALVAVAATPAAVRAEAPAPVDLSMPRLPT